MYTYSGTRIRLLIGNSVAAFLAFMIAALLMTPLVPKTIEMDDRFVLIMGIVAAVTVSPYYLIVIDEIRKHSRFSVTRFAFVAGAVLMSFLVLLTLYLDMVSLDNPEMNFTSHRFELPMLNLIVFGLVALIIWSMSAPKLYFEDVPSTTVDITFAPAPVTTLPTPAPLPSHKDDNLPSGLTLLKIVFGLIVIFVIVDRIKQRKSK